METSRRGGIAAGLCAYGLWGALPLYWKLLVGVPALELLAHRIAWSFFALLLGCALARRLGFFAALGPRTLAVYAVASLLVGSNWLLYVWAVNGGRVVEVSLGYFLNPLVSILLGVLLLGERLRGGQWLAVALAGGGVGVLVLGSGGLPWVSLSLAVSFGGYGLVKKLAPLPSLEGLLLETALLTPPSLLWLWLVESRGQGAFLHGGPLQDALLVGTGLATAAPLLLFGVAARAIPLSTLGLLQYLAPSLQLLLGVFAFGEPFGGARAAAFGLVWLGLAVYAAEGFFAYRRAS